MDDALAMRFLEARAELEREGEGGHGVEWTFAMDPVRERLAFQELHCQEGEVFAVLTNGVDAMRSTDVRVRHFQRAANLRRQAAAMPGPRTLDSDPLAQLLVNRFVHEGHSAAGDFAH